MASGQSVRALRGLYSATQQTIGAVPVVLLVLNPTLVGAYYLRLMYFAQLAAGANTGLGGGAQYNGLLEYGPLAAPIYQPGVLVSVASSWDAAIGGPPVLTVTATASGLQIIAHGVAALTINHGVEVEAFGPAY